MLVVYLNNIKEHKSIHEKECNLSDGILKYIDIFTLVNKLMYITNIYNIYLYITYN